MQQGEGFDAIVGARVHCHTSLLRRQERHCHIACLYCTCVTVMTALTLQRHLANTQERVL